MFRTLAIKGLKRWLPVNLTGVPKSLRKGINHTSKYSPDKMLASLDREGLSYILPIDPVEWQRLS